MNIKPSASIRQNYNDIAELCRSTGEPVYLTKNGEGDLVVMDINSFTKREKMLKLREELLAVEEDRLHGAPDYGRPAMPEFENKFQVIVSKRAAQQLVEHAVFMARLEERLARQLAADFWKAADSLQSFPYRNPILRSSVFVTEKYRKMVFGKWYLLIYQIKGERVFVEYVIDGRQDDQWLIQ